MKIDGNINSCFGWVLIKKIGYCRHYKTKPSLYKLLVKIKRNETKPQ